MNNLLAISEATNIAIHLCVRLTTTGSKLCSTRKIAEEFDFSVNHLAKVVRKLVLGGVLESFRGKVGGIRLLKPQDQITVAELNDLVSEFEEGGCLLSRRVCTGCKCTFGRWLSQENKSIEENLRKTTIKEIADSLKA
jgi:Rrf2 family nitric oxide-sensitive transcriptional repressor